ncbi:MAG: UvrD-helicase domain-containing protein, partial [Spirochaetota bacterium]
VIGPELVQDQTPIVSMLTADYRRRHLYREDPVIYGRLSADVEPEKLVKLLGTVLNHADVRYDPQPPFYPDGRIVDEKIVQLSGNVHRAYRDLCSEWTKSRMDVLAVLGTMDWASGSVFDRFSFASRDADYYGALFDVFLADPEEPAGAIANGFFLKLIEKFSQTVLLAKGTLKKYKDKNQAPNHMFFVLCEKLSEAYNALEEGVRENRASVYSHYCHTVSCVMDEYKKRQHVICFSDLLSGVRDSLTGKRGDGLRRAVAAQYSAVLIDEFQDTDSQQYFIFDTLFGKSGRSVYYIGDPKQAIYSFRGADIHTYLAAARRCEKTFLLSKNRRSHPAICSVVNRLFGREHPFVLDGIVHPDSVATQESRIECGGRAVEPFTFGILPHTGNKVPSRTTVSGVLSRACADRIAALMVHIQRKELVVKSPGKPDRILTASDIAVIVRKKHEGMSISRELKNRGISAVEILPAPLHETREFSEMRILVNALARPHDMKAVNALLASRLCGLPVGSVVDASRDGSGDLRSIWSV